MDFSRCRTGAECSYSLGIFLRAVVLHHGSHCFVSSRSFLPENCCPGKTPEFSVVGYPHGSRVPICTLSP